MTNFHVIEKNVIICQFSGQFSRHNLLVFLKAQWTNSRGHLHNWTKWICWAWERTATRVNWIILITIRWLVKRYRTSPHVNMPTSSFTLEISPGTLSWMTKSVSFALSCYSDYHSNDKDVIISLSLLYHKVNIGKYYFLNNWRNI